MHRLVLNPWLVTTATGRAGTFGVSYDYRRGGSIRASRQLPARRRRGPFQDPSPWRPYQETQDPVCDAWKELDLAWQLFIPEVKSFWHSHGARFRMPAYDAWMAFAVPNAIRGWPVRRIPNDIRGSPRNHLENPFWYGSGGPYPALHEPPFSICPSMAHYSHVSFWELRQQGLPPFPNKWSPSPADYPRAFHVVVRARSHEPTDNRRFCLQVYARKALTSPLYRVPTTTDWYSGSCNLLVYTHDIFALVMLWIFEPFRYAGTRLLTDPIRIRNPGVILYHDVTRTTWRGYARTIPPDPASTADPTEPTRDREVPPDVRLFKVQPTVFNQGSFSEPMATYRARWTPASMDYLVPWDWEDHPPPDLDCQIF